MNWQSGGDAPPALLVLPPGAVSLDEAHAAIEQWEHYSRKRLDPPQRLTVEVMMAEGADGRWAARTTGREMPRQNGKGDELEVVEFWGLTQRGEAILHTAHELNTVSSAHQRMVGLLSHKDFRGKRQPRILNGLGQQLIELGDGVIAYRTRTSGGGRGLDDISRLIVDEAQHAHPEQLASASPTLLANPNPQMNFAGTGGIGGVSDWWWQQRLRALAVDPGDFGYVGHTAERVHLDAEGRVVQDPVDPLDRGLWRAPNPALIFGRTDLAFLEEQLRILGPALFAREHLGVWDPPPVVGGGVIPLDSWENAANPGRNRGDQVAYGVDVSPDLRSASIGVSDGHVVLLAEHHQGAGWLPSRLAALVAEKPGGVWLDPKGPAGALLVDLSEAGVTWHDVTPQEHAQACGGFLGAVMDGRVFHSSQPDLDAAVKGASRRSYGDAWAWNRTTSKVDISPLVAVTIARWAALNVQPAVEPNAYSLNDLLEDDEW